VKKQEEISFWQKKQSLSMEIYINLKARANVTSTAKEASKNMLFLSGRYFQQGILLYAQRDMAPSVRDSTRFA
jgi:hypothetical protein